MGGLISLLAGDHSKGVDIILNFEGNFLQSIDRVEGARSTIAL